MGLINPLRRPFQLGSSTMSRYSVTVLLALLPAAFFAVVQISDVPHSAVRLSESALLSTRGANLDIGIVPSGAACACAEAVASGGMALGFTCDCTGVPNNPVIVCYQCKGLANANSCEIWPNAPEPGVPGGANGNCNAAILWAGVCINGACPNPVMIGNCAETYPICADES
jgi:hypothetical protein